MIEKCKDKQSVDCGSAERWQHGGRLLSQLEKNGPCVARALVEHVLDELLLAGAINAPQREAGLLWRRDFEAAGMGERLTGSYRPIRYDCAYNSDWDDRSDEEEIHYKKWRQAMKLLGPLSSVTLDAVCFDKPPTKTDLRRIAFGLQILRSFYRV